MARTNKTAKPLHPGEQAWVDNMARLIVGDALNEREDERITEKMRDTYPGYAWPGTEPIEADDDDEDRIEAEDEARREEWSEYLEWQRSLGA